MFIKDRKVCVKPLWSRLETTQNCTHPQLKKGVEYDLTRKSKQVPLGEEQQNAFEEIKCRLVKLPILHMPNCEDRFHLYLDTSKSATGSTLYLQNGKPKLIAYASKGFPEGARNYSIKKLELCSLAINIASFSHLLKKGTFQCNSRSLSSDSYH